MNRIIRRLRTLPVMVKRKLRGPATVLYETDGRRYAAFVTFRLFKPLMSRHFEVVQEVTAERHPLPWNPNPSKIHSQIGCVTHE